MARSYMNVSTAIWRDEGFRALTMAEQHCFIMLNTQADVSAAGMLTMALRRWSSRVADSSPDEVREAITGLERKGFVVVDDETEEILIRSFVRWDKGYNNDKRQPAIHNAADAIQSPKLRQALAQEFRRLGAPAECIPESYDYLDGLSDRPSDDLSHDLSDRHTDRSSPSESPDGHGSESSQENRLSHRPSDSPWVVVTESVSTTQPSTLFPQPSTRVPAAASGGGSRGPARKRATRIRDDFAAKGVTPEMVAWAREHAPNVDGGYETQKFVDYWRGKSGKDAAKADWPATWRNWMRKAHEGNHRPRGPMTGANRHKSQRHDNPFSEG